MNSVSRLFEGICRVRPYWIGELGRPARVFLGLCLESTVGVFSDVIHRLIFSMEIAGVAVGMKGRITSGSEREFRFLG